MLRLAVVTSYFPLHEQPYRGHSAYQTLREMKRWAELEVFCPLAVYPQCLPPRNFSYVRADLTYSPPSVRTHYVEYPALPLLSRPINGVTCARRILPHLRAFKPDAILNYGIYPEGYSAVLSARKLKIPVVVGAIGSDLNRIPDNISEWLTRKTLREASFVLAVSRQLRDRAIQLGAPADRTRTVCNGCDTSIFSLADRLEARACLGIDADSTLIVFVGWISPTKGLVELLDAFIGLVPFYNNLQLACVGEGAFRATLERRAVQADIQHRIHFLGPCSSPQVARWLAAANVFCLPSYAEGCPNAVVEALSCGRPVVASAVGGIPDLIDFDSGILVPPRDSVALAEALRHSLGRDWDEHALSRKIQRGWNQVAQETYEICASTVELPVDLSRAGKAAS